MCRFTLAITTAVLALAAAAQQELLAAGKPVKMLRPPSYYHGQRTPATRPAAQDSGRVPRIKGHPITDKLGALYDRTAREFKDGIFYKPSDQSADERERTLAPLLVQEVPGGTSSAPEHLHIGAVDVDASGQMRVDTSRPTVYYAQGFVRLGEFYCEQFTHIWATPGPEGKGVTWHGVRTTYGPNRWPLAWEVLSADGEPAMLFVSRTFEAAAQKQYGGPLPGRRHAAERSLEEQANLLVARVLPDGKEPMGPVVYLDAAAQAVTTLLCRCMKSQIDNFVENHYYDLLPVDILAEVHVATEGPFRLEQGPATDRPDVERPWLEKALRVPKRF